MIRDNPPDGVLCRLFDRRAYRLFNVRQNHGMELAKGACGGRGH
jgi:hypothetical protein